MKKACLILMCALLVGGCSNKDSAETPIKDGLQLVYEIECEEYPEQNSTATYTFKEIADDKYEVTFVESKEDKEDKTRTMFANPQFRFYDSPEYKGTLPGPAGGYLWVPPEKLQAGDVKYLKIIEETIYNSYNVYKSKSTNTKTVSYHDKKTGFLIAHENREGGLNILCQLAETNADGL